MTHPFDLLIENLRGTVPVSTAYMSKEQAYEELKAISGEDWGYDADAWYARKPEILKRIQRTSSPEELRNREIELRRRLRRRRTK